MLDTGSHRREELRTLITFSSNPALADADTATPAGGQCCTTSDCASPTSYTQSESSSAENVEGAWRASMNSIVRKACVVAYSSVDSCNRHGHQHLC
jgi:hypothetical protein